MRMNVWLGISLLLSGTLLGAGGGVGMSTTGAVRTNSVLLPSGSTVFPGDEIETADDSMAVMSFSGLGRVEVRRSTAVTIGDGEMRLHRGTVAAERMPVRVGQYTIAPRDEDSKSWFVVSAREGKRIVAAHRGAVVISAAGAAPLLVPAGSFAAAPAPAPEPDSEKQRSEDSGEPTERKSRTRGAVAAGGTGVQKGGGEGWTIGSLSHATSVALAAGIGAAAAGVGIAAITLGESSPSPSQ